jgi:adhesin transport system outer membrane protein
MCSPENLCPQIAYGLAEREPRARLPGCEVAKTRMELAGHRARIGRFVLLAAALSLPLAGCKTIASTPSSPLLTAVARLPAFRANSAADSAPTNPSPPAANANAATTEGMTTGSLRPSAAAPPSGQQTAEQGRLLRPVGNAPIEPEADRAGVSPQIASATPRMVDAITAARAAAPTAGKNTTSSPGARSERKGISLSDAVGTAVLNHPLMGAQAAKLTGSLADVRTAEGAAKPQMQVYAGSGGSYLGAYSNSPVQFGSVEIPGSSRTDAGFTLKQLVFDFGAARADIARSKSLADAERLRLADQAEDIALRTVNAYLNLLEQEELIALIDKVVADDNGFAELVKLSEKQGNGTLADVNRIKSKVIELEALRTDIKTAYSTAQDEFFRLTRLDSSKVGRPASIASQIPPSFDVAYEAARQYNPSLLALKANGVSIDRQLASQKAQQLPRVDLQSDGLVKHYMGGPTASTGVVDTRLMLMASYKLTDGGVLSAQTERIREDRRANEFRTVDERESIELNLKRFYQALSANRTKESAAVQGISTAQKAHSLYLEQFKAGKRTVFEVLDSRMVAFTMQKNAVNAKYEQMRAAYGILRNMGRLVETAIRI